MPHTVIGTTTAIGIGRFTGYRSEQRLAASYLLHTVPLLPQLLRRPFGPNAYLCNAHIVQPFFATFGLLMDATLLDLSTP